MLQKLATISAMLASLFCSAACSLGLGDIQVGSRLNESLVATIPLTSLSPKEAQGLQVHLATQAEFDSAGIERSDYLSTLSFSVSGSSILITSRQPARDPVINLLVEVHAGNSRVVRGYTLLLDPPGTPSVAPEKARVLRTESTFEGTSEAPVAGDASPDRPAAAGEQRAARAPEEGRLYGPVHSGQTFWTIASTLRPAGAQVSIDQTLLALYLANPQAFQGGIDGLLIGSTLRVPSVEEMKSVPDGQAHRQVMALRKHHAEYPTALPAPTSAGAAVATPALVAPIPDTATTIPAQASAVAPAPAVAVEVASAPAPDALTGPGSAGTSAAVETVPSAPATADGTTADVPTDLPAAPPPSSSAPGDAAAVPVVPDTPDSTPAATVAPAAARPPPIPAYLLPPRPPKPADETPYLLALGVLLLLVFLVVLLWLRRRRPVTAIPIKNVLPSLQAGDAAPSAVVAAPASTDAAPLESALEPSGSVLPQRQPEPEPEPDHRHEWVSTALGAVPPAVVIVPAREVSDALPVPEPVVDAPTTVESREALAEAQRYLANGRYDDAIRRLHEALERDSARLDLKLKLAETYFAAGRSQAFESLVSGLQGQVKASDWGRLVFMGNQLCPDSPLFRRANVEDFDLSSSLPGNSIEFALDARQMTAPEPTAVPEDLGNRVDFQWNAVPEAVASPIWSAPAASWPVAAAGSGEPPPSTAHEMHFLDVDPNDINLYDAEPEGEIATDDEIGTKLDLARAYLDMGDQEMARILLGEVAVEGNAAQQSDAQSLLLRLPY